MQFTKELMGELNQTLQKIHKVIFREYEYLKAKNDKSERGKHQIQYVKKNLSALNRWIDHCCTVVYD